MSRLRKKSAARSFRRPMCAEALEDRRLLAFVPPGLIPGDPYHLVFACSQQTDNTFGTGTPGAGSGAGDAFIQTCANSSSLTSGTSYQAIISDGIGRNANALVPSGTNIPIYNLAGQLVATDYGNLWQGPTTSLVNPVGFDELGAPLVSFAEVWTGTDDFGFHKQSGGNWTGNPAIATTIGIAAGPGANTSQWIDAGTVVVTGASFWVYGISDPLIVPTSLTCDINGDGQCDLNDIDELSVAIVDGSHDPIYDMTGDGVVNRDDGEQWLIEAGEENLGPGLFYLPSDGNLDGIVDGSDFLLWNAHKFSFTPLFSKGDWNYDGIVDGSDFLLWNAHKFSSSDQVATPTIAHDEPDGDVAQRRQLIVDVVFAFDDDAISRPN